MKRGHSRYLISGGAEIQQHVLAWVESGIVAGTDGKLMPTGNAARAQIAAIMMRYSEKIK